MPFSAHAVRARAAQLPASPGVYMMLDGEGTVLYVGKAKNLRRRVGSYARRVPEPRLQSLLARLAEIQVTLTRTEGEALLLENDLIKTHRPRFNVLLRDDKSFPFLYLSTHETFPRLSAYRGVRRTQGRSFGPYPSAGAVRETLRTLQQLFPVRQCRDSVFRHRSRPCLQYQMQRCTAPCVGLISPEDYGREVQRLLNLLDGRTEETLAELAAEMERAAAALAFERAAVLRDRIALLRRMQQGQYVTAAGSDLDLIAAVQAEGILCVQAFFIRNGRNLGGQAFFPQVPEHTSLGAALAAFLTQFYAQQPPPPTILVNIAPAERAFLAAALSERAGHEVKIVYRLNADQSRWLQLALDNAQAAWSARRDSRVTYTQRLVALGAALGLTEPPRRLECFDISHTQGERPVAACVVFDDHGPQPAAYRRFNLEGIAPGDDYAGLAQALERHYRRLRAGEAPLPEVLFVDGGRGQLAVARNILAQLGVVGPLVVGIAKGPERTPGSERLWLAGRPAPLLLSPTTPALQLIQQIRDEAHRFALVGHRRRRARARRVSPLENIPGVGPQRRRQLLEAFGGLRGLRQATVTEIAQIAGIGMTLATRIHDALEKSSAASSS